MQSKALLRCRVAVSALLLPTLLSVCSPFLFPSPAVGQNAGKVSNQSDPNEKDFTINWGDVKSRKGSNQHTRQGSAGDRFSELRKQSAEFYEGLVLREDWVDSARNRTIPVKIYQPKTTGPWPVVIFSHGLGGSREAAGYFGDALRDNGYLAVHVQHPGSDSSVWINSIRNGKVKVGQGDFRKNIQNEMKQAMTGENLRARVDDVKFVLNQLEQKNSVAGPWYHKIDMTKVGCAGHSFGAGTTMAIAGQTFGVGANKICVADPRVKAAVYMSPPVNLAGRDAKALYGSIKIPGMVMTGTEDNSPINNNSAADRIIPYQNINAPEQYLVIFNGGDHAIFGGTQARNLGSRDQSKDAQYHALIYRLGVAFFNAYLRGDETEKQWLKHSSKSFLGNRATIESK